MCISHLCVRACSASSVMSNSLKPYGLQPTRLLCPWNYPGKNTGVGSHSLLQEIFPTQGSNLDFRHCRQNLYQLSHQGSTPFHCIVEWIRSSGSEPQSAPGLVFPDCVEPLHLWLQKYYQSDFDIDRLVISMCRVFSCVVGRRCLL